jgi:cation diffusion facilitator family transporter
VFRTGSTVVERDVRAVVDNQRLPVSSKQRTSGSYQSRQSEVRRILVIVLGLNLLVAGAKIALGLTIGSLAMSADGFHSLLDGMSNVVALVGLAFASRPPDSDHPYGHHRFETLTSLAIASFMLMALFGILQGAWNRWQSGGMPEVSGLAFAVMGATICINLFVTTWERRAGKRLNSTLLIADSRHTLTDVFVSLSVIGSLVAVWLGLVWADLVVSIGIAAAIGWGAWSIVRDAGLALSDIAVRDAQEIERIVLSVDGVRGTHNIRSRGAEGRVWIDLHIQVDPELNVGEAHDISSEVARTIETEFNRPADVTVHVEPADDHHLRDERGYVEKERF